MRTAQIIKGRGAQINPENQYTNIKHVKLHPEGIDLEDAEDIPTSYFIEQSKNIISKNKSPDLKFMHSINPYQGCAHGCIYCYARNTHEYWGFGPGLDFERKILLKLNAPLRLEHSFNMPTYKPEPLFISGNTDCYQPIERKLKLTRALLALCLKYRHPVSIITKNKLILRDLDILEPLARLQLIHVAISLNSLQEDLRRKLEPRTATSRERLNVIQQLSAKGIPVLLMCAPIIPGLNSSEVPEVIREAALHGAQSASYTIVRLNGAVSPIFEDWINKAYPNRAQKVLNAIKSCHGGNLSDMQWGRRIKGDGAIAESIQQLFKISKSKFMGDTQMPDLRTDLFCPRQGTQLSLFN